MLIGWIVPWIAAFLTWLVLILIPIKLDGIMPPTALFGPSPPWVIVCMPLWVAALLMLGVVVIVLATAKDNFLITYVPDRVCVRFS